MMPYYTMSLPPEFRDSDDDNNNDDEQIYTLERDIERLQIVRAEVLRTYAPLPEAEMPRLVLDYVDNKLAQKLVELEALKAD
jgi:hypothetical protein